MTEADPADALEQAQPTDELPPDPAEVVPEAPLEANVADVWEQAQEVPDDVSEQAREVPADVEEPP